MAGDRLTQEEVALVLRRAAELDPETTRPGEDGLPLDAVTAAAAEVGLPEVAVHQAVAELRAGVLRAGDAPAPVDASVVVEAAVVPVELDAALAVLGKWLSAQTFHRHRGRSGVEVWRLREDWFAGLQRSIDWSASVRLKQVREVVVRAVAVEGGTLLRVECTLTGATQAAPTIGVGVAGGAGAAGTAIAASALTPAWAAIGAGLTGIGMIGGFVGGRNLRRNTADRVRDEVAAELDRIGAGTDERNAIDRLRGLARGRRGPAWHRA